MRALPRSLLQLSAAYGAVVAFMFGCQGRLLYPGTARDDVAVPGDARLATYRAADGVTVHALELDAPSPRGTVVYFHGNGEVVGDDVPVARALRALGFSVVLVEYRGYGRSRPGEPGERGLYADAEAALDALEARGEGPRRVVLFGSSLGTGVAAEMAARHRGAGLVLVSPYTSLVDVAAAHVPFLPVRLLMRDRFETLAKAPALAIAALVIHGTADEVVPYAMGQRVAGAIPGARLFTVEGGHHGDLFVDRRAMDAIAAFLASLSLG